MRNFCNKFIVVLYAKKQFSDIISPAFPLFGEILEELAVAAPALTKQRSTLFMTIKENMKSGGNEFSRLGLIVVAAYIAAQMLSDIASLKIGVVGGLAVDMGTFIYPITFTLRDVVHKVLGKRNTRVLILTAGVINLLMALYLMWAASVPGDPGWGLNDEFSAVLGPVWRIVLASIVAEVVSELVDTEIYHLFVTRITHRYQWARVLVSNSVSVPIDNILFAVGAFAFTLPWSVVWDIFVANLIMKYAITLLSLPMIYLSPNENKADM
jgi:uncharacterized integral membrane protein (TIGR00697 family)